MDIRFTPEQERYRAEVRAWIEKNLPRPANGNPFRGPDDEDDNARFQKEWERKLYDAGYSGVAWPRAYGGQGLTFVEHYIVQEELGRVAAPEGINSIGRELVGPIMLAIGTEEQKRHYIPRLLRLDDVWCQGFSEPNAGSDLASVQTHAVRDGAHWLITGQKVWTSYARYSNFCILLARTDREALKHKGITLFLMPMDLRGITIKPLKQITGRSEFNEVFLDDVRVADSLRLGAVNDGWRVANGVLGFERATTRLYRQARFANELRALIALLERSGSRRLAEDAGFRRRLAAVHVEIEVLRYHNLKVVSRIANGATIGPEASLQKLAWSEAHQKLADLAVDILGEDFANGEAAEPFRDIYLQSRAETIYAGTSEIQRNIIADRVLGLPR
ncbi:MAG: acyl-CoA dehydrogenase family protein [Xanthobacteraceae bacterium]